MFKVSIAYVRAGNQDLLIIESLDPLTVGSTAKRMVAEYYEGSSRCEDQVLATLLREEGRQAEEVLRVAGIDVAGEH